MLDAFPKPKLQILRRRLRLINKSDKVIAMLARVAIVVWLPVALAQTTVPEVRGIVRETGSQTGISGVEVGLDEFGPNEQNVITRKLVVSTFTDANGAYSLKPGHTGEFMVSAKKTSYQTIDGRIATLTDKAPTQTVNIGMIRPGTLTGRVIDSEGKPLAKFPITIESPDLSFGDDQVTDAEGYFRSSNLPPGKYLVSIGPRRQARDELVEYTEAEFKIIDQDVEPSYWPGGLVDREGVVPVPVAGGGSANIGTITVRKIPYYRVHMSLAGECGPNERWIYKILSKIEEFPPPQEQFGGCRKEFLLTGLTPGEHTLAVWVGRDLKAWGLAPFTITNRNVETTLRLSPSFSVSGQVKTTEGHTLAEMGLVQVLLRPENGLGAVGQDGPKDADGVFNYKTVAWPQQLLSVLVQKPGVYVKEIRYNGLPLRSARVNMVPGARFEILIDSGAATVTGKVQRADSLMLVRDGVDVTVSGSVPPFQLMAGERIGEETFAIQHVPPGTYRAIVLSRDNLRQEQLSTEELAERVLRAAKFTVEANERKTIEVKQ
jgi:hypothetical protein